MASDPTDPFLVALRESALLDHGRMADLTAWVAEYSPDPQALAKELGRRGWLTAYQIKEIYRGRGRDLTIGPFVVLDLLGEGGMGRVFKAQHTRLGRDVALKVIRKEKLSKPAVVLRFHQEIRAAAQLSHPNVVLAFDADEADGIHYFSMEYVEGTDLTKVVRQQGAIPIALACDYIRQAAMGLQHAYEKGLVHRDVKPSNLLLGTKGQVKVLDLGLALLKENPGGEDGNRVTQEGLVLGTPDFLAPEQAQNPLGVDIRADIYSLGATLYYLLTARVPYEGTSPTDKLLQHVTAPPPDLLRFKPDAPPQLAAVIQWLMAKRSEDRPQTPAHVAMALMPYCPVGAGTKTFAASGYPGAPTTPGSYPASPTGSSHLGSVSPESNAWGPPPVGPTQILPQQLPTVAAAYAPPAPQMPPSGGYPPPVSGGYPVQDPQFAFESVLIAGDPNTPDRPRRLTVREPKPSGPWKMIGLAAIAVVLGLTCLGTVGYYVMDSVVGPTTPTAELTNPAGMKMILLAGGSFSMGSAEGEPGREPSEAPAGNVTVSGPFYIAATEVTHGQYKRIMVGSPAKKALKMRNPDLFPVDSVTWQEATEFCDKLTRADKNGRPGWAYRLPTEAEWEYACRAGTTGAFSSGEKLVLGRGGIFDLDKDTDLKTGLGEADAGKTIEKLLPYPAGLTEANPFKLFDMHGNVWEWCSDYHAADYSARITLDPRGPATGDWRVLRGGSWKEAADRCRSAARRGESPQTRKDDIGFRVVYAPVK